VAGDVNDFIFKDIVSLNGISSNKETMNLVALTLLSSKQHVGFDGIIGLASYYNDDYDCKPEFSFINYLHNTGLIGQKVCSPLNHWVMARVNFTSAVIILISAGIMIGVN
jgi:hypothetical protein